MPATAPGVLGLLTESLTVDFVRSLLHNVIDPELGVNIIDLGLVYEIVIGTEAGAVDIEMTLTTPGCPLSGFLDDEIRRCLAPAPQVRAINVKLVWDPAWNPEMMSEQARQALGWG